jgi:hypothetical protein
MHLVEAQEVQVNESHQLKSTNECLTGIYLQLMVKLETCQVLRCRVSCLYQIQTILNLEEVTCRLDR